MPQTTEVNRQPPATATPMRFGLHQVRDVVSLLLLALLAAICLVVGLNEFDDLRRHQERSQDMIRLTEQALVVSARADAAGLAESAVIYSLLGDQLNPTRITQARARFTAAQNELEGALNGLAAIANDDEWTLELISILQRERFAFLDLHKNVSGLAESNELPQINRARELMAKNGWQLSESISALTQTITLNFSRMAQLSHKNTLEQIQIIRGQLMVSMLIGMTAVALLGWLSNRAWRRARTHMAQLQLQSTTDPLTSLPNRRAFNKRLDEEIARARRDQTPLVLLGLDLDHFKQYNDKHGHPAGDALLRAVSANWQPLLRESDMLARVGGEEFSIIMPNCKAEDTQQLISRLRAATPEGQTFSAGIARLTDQDDAHSLMSRADLGLYSAKRGGRNRTAADATEQGGAMPNLVQAPA